MFGMVHFGSINTDKTTEQQEFGLEYKKLLTWTDDGIVSQFIQVNCLNGTVTILKPGNYNITFSVSFKGTNERNYDLAIFQDDVLVPQVKTQRFFEANLRTGDVYGAGIVNVSSVPSVIDLRAKSQFNAANVMIVENAVLSCIEILPDSATADISCKVSKLSNQSIPNSTSTIISWDEEDYDTNGMHDNVTNNSRITIKTEGKYSVMAQFEWESNSSGKRIIDIFKNSVAVGKANYLASGNSQHTVSFVGDLIVNDIIEIRVFQDSGGSLDFLNNITYFEAHKIN